MVIFKDYSDQEYKMIALFEIQSEIKKVENTCNNLFKGSTNTTFSEKKRNKIRDRYKASLSKLDRLNMAMNELSNTFEEY